MSADDFQTKYSSVMEGMLKGAVAETRKLFETMVDELKAEISNIKKENEDLKTRCSQFENARRQEAVHARESEPRPGQSQAAEQRNRAVQCDLVPFRTMLVEQCQPLRHSSLKSQEQKCGSEGMWYTLQEHNYVTKAKENSQMPCILVKQEQSVLTQQEIEPNMVLGQVLNDKAEMPLPQRDEENRVALKLSCLGVDSSLQGAKYQSPKLTHSQANSFTAITDQIEDNSEVGQRKSKIGTQRELLKSEKHKVMPAPPQSGVKLLEKEQPSVVPQQCQMEGNMSVIRQTDVHMQQSADVKSTEASSQLDLSVPRRRGRPPKKVMHQQQPVKHIIHSPSSHLNNSPMKIMEGVEVSSTADTVNITSFNSPQASPIEPKESLSVITMSGHNRANPAVKHVGSKVVPLAFTVASLSRTSTEKKNTSKSEQLSKEVKEGTVKAQSTDVKYTEACSQPDLSVPRRRGRPPKEVMHQQQPVKQIMHSSSSHLKNSPMKRVEGVEVSSADDTVNITSFNSPQASPIEPKESLSVTTMSGHNRANHALKHVNSKVVPLAFTVASLSRTSTENKNTSKPQQLSKEVKEGTIKAQSTDVKSTEASSQPDLSVPRRRGRPPKKVMHQQQPVKQIIHSPSSHLKNSPMKEVEGVEVSSADDTVNITSFNSPQASPIEPKESLSAITLSGHNIANPAVEHVSSKVVPLAVTGASMSRTSTEKKNTSKSQQLSKEVKEVTIKAHSTDVKSTEASSQPDLSVPRRRGRPPKEVMHQQQPVKQIIHSPSSHLNNSPMKRMEGVEVSSAADAVNITSFNSPQASPIEPKESLSVITMSGHNRANPAVKHVSRKVVPLAFTVASLSRTSTEKKTTSKSQQLSKEVKEGTIKDGSTLVSSETEILKTPTDESVPPRKRYTSVTLQDAMLMFEAMNRSTGENTLSSPQRISAAHQTQCASSVGTLKTVDPVPAEPQTTLLPLEIHEASGNIPVSELSTTEQLTKEELGVTTKPSNVTPINQSLSHVKIVIPKDHHTVTLCNSKISVKPSSTANTQTSVHSLKQQPTHSLIPSVAPSKQGNTVPHNVEVTSVSSLSPHKTAAMSPPKLPTALSTVVAAQKNSPSTAKTLPAVNTQLTANPNVSQSGTLPPPKIAVIISRRLSSVAQRKNPSPAIVLTTKQKTTQSVSAVKLSSPQLISSSQELSFCADSQTTLDDMAMEPSENWDQSPTIVQTTRQESSRSASPGKVSSSQLISSSQELSFSPDSHREKEVAETNEPSKACSSLTVSAGIVSTSVSQVVPLSAVVRLTRLPFQISAKESVSVSGLSIYKPSETQSILKGGATQENPLPVVISTQPSEMSRKTADMGSNVDETSVAISVNTNSNHTEKKALLPSEDVTVLEKLPDGGYMKPSKPSTVSAPVFEKLTTAPNTTKPSTVSGMASGPTSNVDEETLSISVQDCAFPNGSRKEETKRASVIHLTSITAKETLEPPSQMTKTQFLAQLNVTPVVQDPKKVSSNDSVDARASCEGPSTSDKKRLQKNVLVAQLRSHLKAHLQARRTVQNKEPHKEMETLTESPKKHRSEEDSPNEKTTGEPILDSPKSQVESEDITSLKETTIQPTLISPSTSGLCTNGVTSKLTLGETTSASSRRLNGTSESTPVNLRMSRSDRGSKKEISTSVSPRSSSSTQGSPSIQRNITSLSASSSKEKASSKSTKITSVSPSLSKERDSSKCTKITSASPSLSKERASPKRTEITSVSPSSSKERDSSKSTKITSASPSLSKERTSSKRTEITSVSPRGSSLSKERDSSKRSKITSVSPSSRKERASSKSTKITSASPSLSKERTSPKRTEITSVSPSSSKERTSPKRTEITSVSPRRSSLSKERSSPKRSKITSVSPRRFSFGKERASAKRTEITSVSLKRSSSSKDDVNPKKTQNTNVHPQRTTLCRDGTSPNNVKTTSVRLKKTASPKKIKTTSVSPRISSLVKKVSSPKISANVSKDHPSAKQSIGESNSFSPKSCSINLNRDDASSKYSKSKRGSSVVRLPNLDKDGVSPRITQESTPAKKPRLCQDGTSPKHISRVKNGTKLANATTAKTKASMGSSKQSKFQSFANTSQLAETSIKSLTSRKCISTAVWTPPILTAIKTSPAGGERLPDGAPSVVTPNSRELKNQCGECGRILSSSSALQSHINLHTGRRPFACTICAKHFPNSKSLRRHGRVHRNGRIHICQQCDKGFVYRFGLTKHIQTVHGRIKPFICQICNKGFFTKQDVEAHIRIHTGEKPFHCNLCERKFKRKVELNTHIRWHNGEKRHWCPYCGKGFLDYNNLKRHKYIHTGEKPESCPYCPKHFTQSGHLKKHVKNVHKM